MAEGAELKQPRKRVLDEGVGSGSGGEDQTQPDDSRAHGHFLGPPLEVRIPAEPFCINAVIRKRLAPPVNGVERHSHDNNCGENENESPSLNADRNSTVLSVVPD